MSEGYKDYFTARLANAEAGDIEDLKTDLKMLADKAENVVIAYGMGWDMKGVMEELHDTLIFLGVGIGEDEY